MESKPPTARMRSYAVEIKGIAETETPINKLSGGSCVEKLQAGEVDSILGILKCSPRMRVKHPQTYAFCHPARTIVAQVAR